MKLSEHFNRSEFACKCGCGFDTVDAELILLLEEIRGTFHRPVVISSGSRCREYNAAVGGKQSSQHLLGRAADIVIHGTDPLDVQRYIDAAYPDSYGLGRYTNFTHIDTRNKKARW